jgi:hypothetical protein
LCYDAAVVWIQVWSRNSQARQNFSRAVLDGRCDVWPPGLAYVPTTKGLPDAGRYPLTVFDKEADFRDNPGRRSLTCPPSKVGIQVIDHGKLAKRKLDRLLAQSAHAS